MLCMDTFAVVPTVKGDSFVSLTRSKTGRIFRKQILRRGTLVYPGVRGGKVEVNDEFLDRMISNFEAKVTPIVQVPKVNNANEHVEDPDRNIGEVINIFKNEKGLFADIDVRTDDADKVGKTLLGASAMFHLDYPDTDTGKKAGPTLLHVAVTNRPYVRNLDDFEEVVAASAYIRNQNVVALTPADEYEGAEMPTLDEMKAVLLSEHGIDVDALQAKAEQSDAALALSAKIQEELVGTGLLKLSAGDEVDADTLIGAVAEAGTKIVELSSRVDALVEDAAKKEAESEVEKLVLSGHILPKDKDAMLELRLSNKELFEKLIPEKPVVKLSVEDGTEPADDSHQETVEAEIARLTALAAEKTSTPVRS